MKTLDVLKLIFAILSLLKKPEPSVSDIIEVSVPLSGVSMSDEERVVLSDIISLASEE